MSSALEAPLGKTSIANLDHNLAAALCYLPIAGIGPIASLLFFFTEPKDSKLVRFHALQSLLTVATLIASSVVLTIISIVLPIVGAMLGDTIALVMSLATLALSLAFLAVAFGLFLATLFSMYKAYTGAIFRIPIIGQIADKISG